VHDYHAAEALVERLTAELDQGQLERISEVRIRASPVFSSEALQQAYEILVQGTPLQGSLLVVEDLPDERECPACGRSWLVSRDDLAGHMLLCPSCGAVSTIEGGSGIEVVSAVAGPRS
jgi:Zn finger protein HypA/HybF involved in hydrogenase expression